MAKIVVIEDEPDMRGLILRKLETVPHQVSVAGTGASGWELVQRQRPDLVVLDVQLPDLSGLNLCQRIRADPATRDTLIMMVSASAAQNEVDDGLRVGADDYLTKPFAPSQLVARIEALLAGREGSAD